MGLFYRGHFGNRHICNPGGKDLPMIVINRKEITQLQLGNKREVTCSLQTSDYI